MLKPSRFRCATLLRALSAPLARGEAAGSTVNITQDLPSATFLHRGKPVHAAPQGGLWDFTVAKTLVFCCNGPWCGQSPTNIRELLALGYPVHKLKWYRAGIQGWKALRLTTVPYKKQP